MESLDSNADTTRSHLVDLDPPANVLVLAPTMDDAADGVCADLLLGPDPSAVNVLLVTMIQSPDQRLDALRRRSGDVLGNVAAVGVGDRIQGQAGHGAEEEPVSVPGTDVQTTFVSEPGDLTGIGIKVAQALSAWEDSPNRTHVCLHSVTALLQFSDVQRVFRFLHVLTKRIESANGVAHFHMDPAAHDDRTLATIRSLFDALIEYDGDEWSAVHL